MFSQEAQIMNLITFPGLLGEMEQPSAFLAELLASVSSQK